MRPLLAALILAACAREPARSEAPALASSAPAAPAPAAPAPIAPAPIVNAAPIADAAPTPIADAAPAENDPRWHSTLRAIAAGYRQWGRVDDEFRWAPGLCRMPTPARARISASGDEGTHGRKLYTLYAKDPVAYGAPASAHMMPGEEPTGLSDISQVLVKEAFTPVETTQQRDLNLLPAEHGGKLYLPGEPMGLYVLFKPLKSEPAATDAGWVYGTIAADMKTITGAGKIDSCMGCHQSLPGRLFGLQKSAPR
ncbi:MAG: hypothetical protein H0T76_27895 [Nannocystis sp.]|nr:hypothetical protein [Nannocystis sp.]MBA3550316.1 hypothetical protein [Nannocystis sp.]